MSFTRTAPAGLVCKTLQRIAMNTTATALNTTAQACDNFVVSVEAKSVRVRFDWTNSTTAPTTNTGILLTTTTSPFFFGGVDATKIKFMRTASGAILQVAAFLPISSKVSA